MLSASLVASSFPPATSESVAPVSPAMIEPAP
jgi:hypothetical protein